VTDVSLLYLPVHWTVLEGADCVLVEIARDSTKGVTFTLPLPHDPDEDAGEDWKR